MKNKDMETPAANGFSARNEGSAEGIERARLQADVAQQGVRLAKDELRRARKRLKEAKREAKRSRKHASLAHKDWKRARRQAKKAGSPGEQPTQARLGKLRRKSKTARPGLKTAAARARRTSSRGTT